ncbi:hypothetical protein VI06_21055 [Aquitalea magnusonii]|nr:hypothetical protein VI06_21055 [Aquitalea magnusonii]
MQRGLELKHIIEIESELSRYLQGIVEQWHKAPTPTEQQVWEYVQHTFSLVESERERQWLQEQTVDLLEKALTFVRLDS